MASGRRGVLRRLRVLACGIPERCGEQVGGDADKAGGTIRRGHVGDLLVGDSRTGAAQPRADDAREIARFQPATAKALGKRDQIFGTENSLNVLPHEGMLPGSSGSGA